MRKLDGHLVALATHLQARRAAILRAWRERVEADPDLTTGSSLPRTQLHDHIPDFLRLFSRKLQNGAGPSEELEAESHEKAAGHGLQRWQQGYRLREVTREWGHLHICLVDELESYALTHPELEPKAMATAHRELVRLCNDGLSESTAQYFELQQTEAEGHLRDMQQTLAQVHALERQRAQLWQQAAHDLRGNLGVMTNVTSGLSRDGVPEEIRDELLRLLHNSVSSLSAMLEDVMRLARLQAGRELRQVVSFDVAALLKSLCESLKPMADEGGLSLQADGPANLMVEGDANKTRRIAQNLLLNALKYTEAGGVTVSWGDSRNNDAERWMLCIQDTGPGFHAGPGAPLAEALKGATAEARHMEERAGNGHHWADGDPADLTDPDFQPADDRPVHQERGEGIGLSIVKRLCELLDATLELESEAGVGTIFRVVLPRRYDAVSPRD